MPTAATTSAICAPGGLFELGAAHIRGQDLRIWQKAVPDLATLVRIARGHGAAEFIVSETDRMSYEGWYRATLAMTRHLERLGVTRGERVAIAMRNLPEWPVAFFAAAALGAIAVPLNAWWVGPELVHGLTDSGARVLICDPERLARIEPHRADLPALAHVIVTGIVTGSSEDLPAGCTAFEAITGPVSGYADLPDGELPGLALAPDDDAAILYTSGTTGQPKGALLTHRNLTGHVQTTAFFSLRAFLRRGQTPPAPKPAVMLIVIPLFHISGLAAGMMGAMLSGSKMIFMRRWNAGEALELIERERVTFTGGVPTIPWELIDHPDRARRDLSSLVAVGYGGAPSAPELPQRILQDLGAMPGNGWGMTETSGTVVSLTAEDYLNRPDSAGQPIPVADLRIMSRDGGEILPVGEVGELWVRGPMVFKGYWNRPEATAETLVEGWLRTGDLARMDAESHVQIVDRAKEMLLRGGENIYTTEVENALFSHPAVVDASVVGRPHRTLGEEPVAAVHLALGAELTEAELRAWAAERLAAFKVPQRILFLPQILPRNAAGKILKSEIAKLFLDA